MTSFRDFSDKVEEIRQIIRDKKADALIINSQANFSYVTRGRGFIGLASIASCCSLILTMDEVYIVSDNIESNRLIVDQIGQDKFVKVLDYPWNNPQQKDELFYSILGSKIVLSEDDVAKELFMLRTVFSDSDIEDYKRLCAESAIILEKICKNDIVKGMSEYELAGVISKKLWEENIEPITILIGFDERAFKFRHPVMAGAQLENYALIAICARRNGLIASLTRNILVETDEELLEKHKKCAYVDAVFTHSIKAGNNIRNLYKEASRAYKKVGYEGEQNYHHQGGLTGFVPRELKADDNSDHIIRNNEAFAFNPSLQGAKTEDTILLTKDGVEVMTYTGSYTYVDIEIDGIVYQKPTAYVLNP